MWSYTNFYQHCNVTRIQQNHLPTSLQILRMVKRKRKRQYLDPLGCTNKDIPSPSASEYSFVSGFAVRILISVRAITVSFHVPL